MKGKIYIGTSGWHYEHWIGTFYPEDTKADRQLEYYLKFFKTVEINNSFYRVPQPMTFSNWTKAVPDDFTFAVKANRFFTHLKKLKVEKADIERFVEKMDLLEGKGGPILFQLPPRWKINPERLASFLAKLPSHHRYTIEFRDRTWYQEEVYELLRQFNVAFCIYELAGHLSPIMATADFVYLRLHGPGDKYQGSYSKEQLQEWAVQCIQWQEEGKDVFVYFDNDEKGYAAYNARDLSRHIHQ
jgi:uncharacterized protein YecE (DUF72 family)